ncbi:hypothetical protein ABTZ58_39990 [Streptomyces sp. NPDC094143]|uniref:hypothetical protein n=1 Tax=Streptomyces sp. NPDC094143 TaxID=3155310 RepID=UPI0033348403
MRKACAFAAATGAVVAALAAPASAAGTPDAVTPECRAGKVVISYEGHPQSDKDWYGLYNAKPNNANWRDGLVNYTSGDDQSGEWQWASTGDRYYTTAQSGNSLRTVYWTWNGSEYEWVSDTEPVQLYCK